MRPSHCAFEVLFFIDSRTYCMYGTLTACLSCWMYISLSVNLYMYIILCLLAYCVWVVCLFYKHQKNRNIPGRTVFCALVLFYCKYCVSDFYYKHNFCIEWRVSVIGYINRDWERFLCDNTHSSWQRFLHNGCAVPIWVWLKDHEFEYTHSGSAEPCFKLYCESMIRKKTLS